MVKYTCHNLYLQNLRNNLSQINHVQIDTTTKFYDEIIKISDKYYKSCHNKIMIHCILIYNYANLWYGTYKYSGTDEQPATIIRETPPETRQT